jgi:uncharacterized DUF497 family protein
MYHFEFDSKKRNSNLNKHGMDFVEAQGFWDDLTSSKSKRNQTMNPVLSPLAVLGKTLVSSHNILRRYYPNNCGEVLT